ncbi:MAG: hypothetical protein KAR20_09760 [Candidatus Heimdallarchaeota archaeon]|nr:hypothetical protein [Candidatus Heimdallarchaeota archaeon]
MNVRPLHNPIVFFICASCTRGFEGNLFTAIENGWSNHLCPLCQPGDKKMECVKDCYFKASVRTENKDGEVLYRGFFCELYEKRLVEKDVRCIECENHETLFYSKKMNVFRRMVLNNAEKRMGELEKAQ